MERITKHPKYSKVKYTIYVEATECRHEFIIGCLFAFFNSLSNLFLNKKGLRQLDIYCEDDFVNQEYVDKKKKEWEDKRWI